MFNKNKILRIVTISKKERWPYPVIFEALAEAGVKSYEVDVATHEIVYFGHQETVSEDKPLHFQALAIAQRFDAQAIKEAIKKSQTRELDYEQFLRSIAQAGVHHYCVKMSQREIIYYGKNPDEYYSEIILEKNNDN